MVRHHKSMIIAALLTVIISTESRPADGDAADSIEIPSRSDSLQMFAWNRYYQPARDAASSTSSKRLKVASVPWSSHPNVEFASSPLYLDQEKRQNDSKLSSTDLPSASKNLECLGQSKPLFFKSILNRLRWENFETAKNIEIRKQPQPQVQAQAQHQHLHQPQALHSDLECRSESKVLNLKNRNHRSNAESSHPNKRYVSEFEYEDTFHLPASVSVSASAPIWLPNFFTVPPTANNYGGDQSSKLLGNAVQQSNFIFHSHHASVEEPSTTSIRRIVSIPKNDTKTQKQPLDISTRSSPIFHHSEQQQQQHSISNGNLTVNVRNESTAYNESGQILTKIILKPLANAIAGKQGIAISAPISTAYVRRGDYVQIEYLPEAKADVGEGGIAISRPELVIHFVDRRRK